MKIICNSVVVLMLLLSGSCTLIRPVPEQGSLTIEAFNEHPFGEKITTQVPEDIKGRLKLEKKPVANVHLPEQIDTVLIYKFRQSEFYFYQSPQKTLFFQAEIRNSRIRLAKNIRTGITRKTFFESFTDLDDNNKDTVRVEGEYQHQSVEFYFKRNKLEEIKIEQHID